MVWRSISLSVARKQLLVGCREQLGIKSSSQKSCTSSKLQIEIKKMLLWSVNKMFLFEKVDKNVQFNSLFLRNSWNFCVRVRQGVLFNWGLKMLSVWSSVLLTVFRFRNAWKENVSVLFNKVSALEHERFKQVLLCTASCGYLQILSLGHKLDYERSGFNIYQIVSLFQWFK